MQKQKRVPEIALKKCVGIKKIEHIGKEDVYNMEVEDNHNFAVNGGLIVHNCMDDTRYFVKTKRLAKVRREYSPILHRAEFNRGVVI